MDSVTSRIEKIKQPYGGYLKPSEMDMCVIDDGNELAPDEYVSVKANIIGLVVDYLTRFMLGEPKEEAFRISLEGAKIKQKFVSEGEKEANEYLSEIKGLDEISIENACRLATFDVWRRSPFNARMSDNDIFVDYETTENIQIMVQRSLDFFKEYGPVIKSGFTFEPNGYTETVSSGDGDYLTKDTLWDFKVSKKKPTSVQTLQLLMYWIMGKHSGNPIYDSITNIGIFNPRLNTVYTYDMSKMEKYIIEMIEDEVIGYDPNMPKPFWDVFFSND